MLTPVRSPDSEAAPATRNAALAARSSEWGLAGLGSSAAVAAAMTSPSLAGAAAAQVWPPFVLVAGLLLVGLVADQDGLFSEAGRRLASVAPDSSMALFAGAAILVALVTALLNLDTSVVFLTPVLIYAARFRGDSETALLVGCVLLATPVASCFPPRTSPTSSSSGAFGCVAPSSSDAWPSHGWGRWWSPRA
jgi:arsenical pump membrane protein